MSDTYSFQAEINQLMSLIINSFYSNREIFLRELVSNASDAIDKHRHSVLTEQKQTPESNYYIRIIPNKEDKTLTIEDNGIGMTKQDIIDNIGTIARSGTRAFMEKMNKEKDSTSLIGQFGVGFYSAYLVADNVKVFTSKDNEHHVWESKANGTFTINEVEETFTHGSKIVLYLKDDQHEFLEESKIKSLIKKHNQFILHPIEIYVTKTITEEVEEETEEIKEETEDEDTEKEDKEEVTVEEVDEKPKKMKKVDKIINEFEHINKDKPIWTRTPEDVSDDEYKSFYKTVSSDWDEPLAKKHFNVEGQLEYRSILYIPKRAPFDLFEKSDNKKNGGIKLYVKKVFVTDDEENLLPEWLGFIKGVVDSEDLPLNVSREFLQQNKVLKTIQKNLIKKSLEMIGELNEEDTQTFYKEFSKCLKLGAYHETTHRNKLMNLLRYNSTQENNMITLKDYVNKLSEKQEYIYYMCGESVDGMKRSPFIERFNKLGINVLLMNDPIDEYMMQQIKEYSGDEDTKYKFISVTKEGLKLPGEEAKEDSDEIKKLCEEMKTLLGDKVDKVITSNRIVDAPSCIVTSEYGWTANMERIMKAQALRNDTMGGYMSPKKVFEINPEHNIIKSLVTKLKNESTLDKSSKDVIQLLFEVSLISSGFSFEDPSNFAKRMYRVISLGTNNDDDEIDVSVSDPIPPEEETCENEDKMEEVD